MSSHAQNGSKPPSISTSITSQTEREQLWQEVVQFLKSLKFDEYIDVFASEGFDRMIALYDIDMDDLRGMKVKRGHAKIILVQIEQYKASKNNLSPNKRVRFGNSGKQHIYPHHCIHATHICIHNT